MLCCHTRPLRLDHFRRKERSRESFGRARASATASVFRISNSEALVRAMSEPRVCPNKGSYVMLMVAEVLPVPDDDDGEEEDLLNSILQHVDENGNML